MNDITGIEDREEMLNLFRQSLVMEAVAISNSE
jgi:hypothetical protein